MINDFRNSNYPVSGEDFATDAGAKVKPTPGEMASGFSYDGLVPATKLNWLLARQTAANKLAIQKTFGDFEVGDSPWLAENAFPGATARINGITRYGVGSSNDSWCLMASEIDDYSYETFWSKDGKTWYPGVSFAPFFPDASPYVPRKAMVATESGHIVIVYPAMSPGEITIGYTLSISSIPFTTRAIYGANKPNCMAVEYSGNRLMIGDNGGMIHTLDGVTGAVTSRTAASAAEIVDINHVSDGTWLALDSSGVVRISTNSGASWSAIGAPVIGFSQFLSLSVGQSGRAMIMARQDDTFKHITIYFSDDYYTWTPATLQFGTNIVLEEAVGEVLNLGGGVWVSTGSLRDVNLGGGATNYQHYMLVSSDNGATWGLGNMLSNGAANDSGMEALGFSGSSYIAVGVKSMIRGFNNHA